MRNGKRIQNFQVFLERVTSITFSSWQLSSFSLVFLSGLPSDWVPEQVLSKLVSLSTEVFKSASVSTVFSFVSAPLTEKESYSIFFLKLT